ncbi:MAG: T9SS type A sorting domain-containing protein [Flavobacterium sp.]
MRTDPENTVFQSLSNPGVPIDATISVYPNPAKDKVTIRCNNSIRSVELYDVQGRILQTSLVNENQTNIDMSSQSSGIYFARIITDNGMKVEKIVRE